MRALESFFRKGNLIALRELALRRVAERVDAQMLDYREEHRVVRAWPVAERLVVLVGPSAAALQLVRATRRLASRLHADWIALHVETARTLRLPQAERDRVTAALRLAEQLGGESVTLSGEDVVDEVLRFASQRNVSRLVAGKPRRPRWHDFVGTSQLDRLVRGSEGIQVVLIDAGGPQGESDAARRPSPGVARREYVEAALVVGAITGVARLLVERLEPTNLAMLYLLGVVLVSTRAHRRVAALAAVLSVLAFDFFLVPPYYTFAVSDTEYVVTFIGMLVVGLTIATLSTRLRAQLAATRVREQRATALNALARDLATAADLEAMLAASAARIRDVFLTQVLILLPAHPGVDDTLEVRASESVTYRLDGREDAVARWVFANGRAAGQGTATLPAAKGLYLPLRTPQGTIGVLGLHPAAPQDFGAPDHLHFLEAFAAQLALAIERARLAASSRDAGPVRPAG